VKRKTTEEFIVDAWCKHGDKYNYSLVDYKNNKTKINIICPIHGLFKQIPNDHLRSRGCNKCAFLKTPKYDTYAKQLQLYNIKCRRNKENFNILEVKCVYCNKWYIPTFNSIWAKIKCIKGKQLGESNLYCSDECKQACPTYRQVKYPKGFKKNTSREVQPALRKLVLKRDNYTCQKCYSKENGLHCHHYEGIEINPIESVDIDTCITLCKKCHNEIHKNDKCGMKQYKRKECNVKKEK